MRPKGWAPNFNHGFYTFVFLNVALAVAGINFQQMLLFCSSLSFLPDRSPRSENDRPRTEFILIDSSTIRVESSSNYSNSVRSNENRVGSSANWVSLVGRIRCIVKCTVVVRFWIWNVYKISELRNNCPILLNFLYLVFACAWMLFFFSL